MMVNINLGDCGRTGIWFIGSSLPTCEQSYESVAIHFQQANGEEPRKVAKRLESWGRHVYYSLACITVLIKSLPATYYLCYSEAIIAAEG